MISSANPLASQAGARILAAGGSATDALIAAQMVLNLVEPQSSGVGGGAFIVRYDAAQGQVQSYDGRETAPAAASRDRFMKGDNAIAFRAAVKDGRSGGVPGEVAVVGVRD